MLIWSFGSESLRLSVFASLRRILSVAASGDVCSFAAAPPTNLDFRQSLVAARGDVFFRFIVLAES